MSNKGQENNKEKNEDRNLWDYVTRGIEPLTQNWPFTHQSKKNTTTTPKSKPKTVYKPIPQDEKQQKSESFDRKLAAKIRKGKIDIEATLDLHGMTQNQAHEKLNAFIMQAYQQDKRCVLVITGKGSKKPDSNLPVSERQVQGVLKARLPDWLSQPSIASYVHSHKEAAQKHGGGGAFYVYLRKRK